MCFSFPGFFFLQCFLGVYLTLSYLSITLEHQWHWPISVLTIWHTEVYKSWVSRWSLFSTPRVSTNSVRRGRCQWRFELFCVLKKNGLYVCHDIILSLLLTPQCHPWAGTPWFMDVDHRNQLVHYSNVYPVATNWLNALFTLPTVFYTKFDILSLKIWSEVAHSKWANSSEK